MNELTYQNHFKFGFNGAHFNSRHLDKDTFNVEYGRCERDPLTFRHECIVTAQLIAEKAAEVGRFPVLCFSGGIDSEVMANAFLAAGVEFKVAVAIYGNNLNFYDTSWATKWCADRGIEYTPIGIDVSEFWNSDLFWLYCLTTKSVSPQFPVYMEVMRKINDQMHGYPVLGSGECYLEKEGNRVVMFEREKVATMYQFLFQTGIPGCAGFFQYTPEIMLSFLDDDVVCEAIHAPDFENTLLIKPKLYGNHFDLAPRKKYTGFEGVQDLSNTLRAQLERSFPTANQIIKTEYNNLVQLLWPHF